MWTLKQHSIKKQPPEALDHDIKSFPKNTETDQNIGMDFNHGNDLSQIQPNKCLFYAVLGFASGPTHEIYLMCKW